MSEAADAKRKRRCIEKMAANERGCRRIEKAPMQRESGGKRAKAPTQRGGVEREKSQM